MTKTRLIKYIKIKNINQKSFFLFPFIATLILIVLIEIMEAIFQIKGQNPTGCYYLIQFVYLFIGLPIFYFITFKIRNKKNDKAKKIFNCNQFIKCCLLIALIALLMIAIDRVFIQNVDYSDGIVAAREYWREGAQQRNSPSSILSVLGNLLYPFVFVAAILFTVFYEIVRWRFAVALIVIGIILTQSLITGGRTSILLLCAVFSGALLMRKILQKPLVSKSFRLMLGLTFFIFVSFAGIIFSMRASHNRMYQDEYAIALLKRHHGEWSDNRSRNVTLPESVLASVVYFVHPKWLLQQVVENPKDKYGYALLSPARSIIVSRLGGRMGIDLEASAWTYAGNWLSLPGQAFHDFGGAGVILASVVMWSLLAAAVFAVKRDMQTGTRCTTPGIILIGSFILGMFVWSPVYSILDIVEGLYLLISITIVVFVSKIFGCDGFSCKGSPLCGLDKSIPLNKKAGRTVD